MKTVSCLILALALVGCGKVEKAEPGARALDFPHADEARLDALLAQYAPYKMTYDASALPPKEKMLLKKLVAASKLINQLYLQQTSKAGVAFSETLSKDPENPTNAKLLTLLRRNAMPYDQLQDNETFVGDTPYYGGGELYPHGMTQAQFDAHFQQQTPEVQAEWMYPYTVIQKDGDGYKAVRYHEVFKPYVDEIAKLLREAADLAENASFEHYLRLKADALQTDNYFDADVAWIDVSGNKYEICIGPFETYSDKIKGVKAKYESFVEVVDQEESARLDIYTKYLQAMEQNLPIPDEYKSNVDKLTAKFVIVQGIHRGGEAIAGYQAVAANLPNDERVHAKKGTVKTFWKEMFTARFDTVIKPVSERLLDKEQLQHLNSDGFFQFVLMHEICHAVGPRAVKVGPKKGMATNAAIGPAYNALEEAKADIAGLMSLDWLMKEGVVDASREKEFYVNYLGSLFRSARFGIGQAHGRAAVMSLHYLMDQGSISYNAESKRFSIVFGKFADGVRSLSRELLLLLGNGDGAKVDVFFEKWVQSSPQLEAALKTVIDLPTDVLPSYEINWGDE